MELPTRDCFVAIWSAVVSEARRRHLGQNRTMHQPPASGFLAKLDADQQSALLALGTRREFPRAAILMYEGEPGERIMIIESGRVKVTRIESDGQETLLSVRDPGDILGELAFIDGEARMATVTALEPVQATVIASSGFRTHLQTTPRVALALLEVVTGRVRESALRRSQFARLDTVGRLCLLLVELADRYGQRVDQGIVIDLPLSQDEVAAWTGASRAGVAKALQTLRRLGWIETQRRRIIVRQLDAVRARTR